MRSVWARRLNRGPTKQSIERREKKTEQRSRDESRNKSTLMTKFNWRRDDLMIWWEGRCELEMMTQRLSRQRAQPHYSINSNGRQRDRKTDRLFRSFHRTFPEQYLYLH
ncbi:hypothetical protein BT93_G0124 [Corymbia citriodora subsp. variegata]|nr:hypothetical protein BT93_G0124 [Corymbia citriodora subsp. variegata]